MFYDIILNILFSDISFSEYNINDFLDSKISDFLSETNH